MRSLPHAATLALLLVAPPVFAEVPKAVIAGDATAPANSFVFLDGSKSTSDPGVPLRWTVTPATPLVVMSSPTDPRPGVYVGLPAAKPGTYRVKLTVKGKPDPAKDALDADAEVFDVTVGGGPAPPDVTPTDPLAILLAAAFKADPDAALVPKLAAVFRSGATAASTAATWGELFKSMADAAAANGVAGKLALVQLVTSAELKAKLPSRGASDTPVDAAGKKLAFETLTRIALALESLK